MHWILLPPIFFRLGGTPSPNLTTRGLTRSTNAFVLVRFVINRHLVIFTKTMSNSSRLVIIDYHDLVSTEVDLSIQLERAFGGRQRRSTLPDDENEQSPLGIIAIKNVPNFVDAKMNFLPLAHPLAHLEAAYLETHLSDPKSSYNAGW
jgi:hypothetical protein